MTSRMSSGIWPSPSSKGSSGPRRIRGCCMLHSIQRCRWSAEPEESTEFSINARIFAEKICAMSMYLDDIIRWGFERIGRHRLGIEGRIATLGTLLWGVDAFAAIEHLVLDAVVFFVLLLLVIGIGT